MGNIFILFFCTVKDPHKARVLLENVFPPSKIVIISHSIVNISRLLDKRCRRPPPVCRWRYVTEFTAERGTSGSSSPASQHNVCPWPPAPALGPSRSSQSKRALASSHSRESATVAWKYKSGLTGWRPAARADAPSLVPPAWTSHWRVRQQQTALFYIYFYIGLITWLSPGFFLHRENLGARLSRFPECLWQIPSA